MLLNKQCQIHNAAICQITIILLILPNKQCQINDTANCQITVIKLLVIIRTVVCRSYFYQSFCLTSGLFSKHNLEAYLSLLFVSFGSVSIMTAFILFKDCHVIDRICAYLKDLQYFLSVIILDEAVSSFFSFCKLRKSDVFLRSLGLFLFALPLTANIFFS